VIISPPSNLRLARNSAGVYSLLGDWGKLIFNGTKSRIEKISIHLPAIHYFTGKRYPAEIWLHSKGLVYVVLVDRDDLSEGRRFFEEIGLGNDIASQMQFGEMFDVTGRSSLLNGVITDDKEGFLLYNATGSDKGLNEGTIVIIQTTLFYVSGETADKLNKNFPQGPESEFEDNIILFTNIRDFPYVMPDIPLFPGPISFWPYLTNVTNMDDIPKGAVPFWEGLPNGTVITRSPPSPLPSCRFIPLYWMPHGNNTYTASYVSVRRDRRPTKAELTLCLSTPTHLIASPAFGGRSSGSLSAASPPSLALLASPPSLALLASPVVPRAGGSSSWTSSFPSSFPAAVPSPSLPSPALFPLCRPYNVSCYSAKYLQRCLPSLPCPPFYLGNVPYCDYWDVGVVLNRHYRRKEEWNFTDRLFYKEGAFKVCRKWRFRKVWKTQVWPFGKVLDVPQKKPREVKKKEEINVYCKSVLRVVLNRGNATEGEQDQIVSKCVEKIAGKWIPVEKGKIK